MVCRAVLIKLQSDNGFFTIEPGVSLGKVYWVYPESIQEGKFWHTASGRHHYAQIIFCEEGGFLPLELLEVTEETKPEVLQ